MKTKDNTAAAQPGTEGANGSGRRKGRRKSRFAWFNEAFALKSVYRLLLGGTVLVLALDFKDIYDAANAPLPGKTDERVPVTMEPPKPTDQVRPYLPLTNPVRRPGASPKMPGYAKPQTAESIGEKMTFRRGPKGAASAIGRIEVGTASELVQFIKGQEGEIKTLHLHSPGGVVEEAVKMSAMLREEKIDTIVPENGYCASSCPIVFAGGKKRTAAKRAWIGVHQVFAVTASPGGLHEGMARGQRVSARVQEHLAKMGVDPKVWVKAMQTPADQLYVFTPKELSDYKLATDVIGRSDRKRKAAARDRRK